MTSIQTYTVSEMVTCYIDGRWQAAGSHRLPVVNPATEQIVSYVSEADAQETACAVDSAHRAHKSGVAALISP